MIRPARIVGFAAIALAAFGTAASIAAIGGQSDLGPVRYSDLHRAAPAAVVAAAPAEEPLDACSVTLVVGEGIDGALAPVELSVVSGESMDLDMPDSAGFSVACGAGAGTGAAGTAELGEADLVKGDLLATL